MDDKTFVAEYTAGELLRINKRLKDMVESEETPSDEVRDDLILDIETTLARLQSALSHIMEHLDDDEKLDD